MVISGYRYRGTVVVSCSMCSCFKLVLPVVEDRRYSSLLSAGSMYGVSNAPTVIMTNSEKITELQMQVLGIRQDIEDNAPDRLSAEDVEDVSDNYQANLEYGWYVDEQEELISQLQADIVALQQLQPGYTYNDPAIEEIEWPVVDGLRYVSEEVGYVDQDEEYR
jgi:hypothetical protein